VIWPKVKCVFGDLAKSQTVLKIKIRTTNRLGTRPLLVLVRVREFNVVHHAVL